MHLLISWWTDFFKSTLCGCYIRTHPGQVILLAVCGLVPAVYTEISFKILTNFEQSSISIENEIRIRATMRRAQFSISAENEIRAQTDHKRKFNENAIFLTRAVFYRVKIPLGSSATRLAVGSGRVLTFKTQPYPRMHAREPDPTLGCKV